MAKFILLKLVGKKPQAAVYKIIFDDWKYYIGGTVNIKQRMWGWKFKLNSGARKNIDMLEIFKTVKIVRFEIIEFVYNPEIVKQQEDFYIKQNWGDPLLLNRCPNAFNNIGSTQSPKRLPRPRNKSQMKRIAKVDAGGNILEIYDCIMDAEKANETTTISDSMRKQGLRARGEIYRKLDKTGKIIEPPFVPNKPRPKGYKFSEEGRNRMRDAKNKRIEAGIEYIPDWAKRVIQIDKTGKEIAVHRSVGSACKAIGLKDVRRLRKLLNGREGKSIYGFTFKFAI